jgi:iron complex transport system ATP-binding protein
MSWRCQELTFRYPGAEHPAVAAVSLDVPEGSCTAVLGPNGSGKSTLFRLLLGTLAPASGTAEFGGRPVRDWERRAMARAVGVVGQGEESVFPLTARELVALGRFPHLGPWRREGPRDRAAIAEAMERCDVLQFADRPLGTLSGGERQRVRLARALAQEPAALALDEPTTALDVQHEMEIFELLRGFVSEGGTVLLITHHLNLAARYADRLVLLDGGRLAAHGTPAEVFREERLEGVYRWPLRVVPFPGPGRGEGAPQVLPLSPEDRGRETHSHDSRPNP